VLRTQLKCFEPRLYCGKAENRLNQLTIAEDVFDKNKNYI